MFTERLVTGDAKATFNQAALNIDISTVGNFNKVLWEMTKHAFPAYFCCEQKRPRSMKWRSFLNPPQELNTCLEEFPHDKEGQETAPLPVDEIMDSICYSMPTTWKNKMIEHGFNVDSTIKEMTDFFETRV